MDEQRIKLIGDLLRQQGATARTFVQYMDSDREYMEGDKLYMREAHFVMAIGPGDGQTMSEVARIMNITQGAVSQIASRLEKKGYISRKKNEKNRRQTLAYLTQKGEQFYEEHQKYDASTFRYIDEIALKRFSNEQLCCILEYEQIIEKLMLEEAPVWHGVEKSETLEAEMQCK